MAHSSGQDPACGRDQRHTPRGGMNMRKTLRARADATSSSDAPANPSGENILLPFQKRLAAADWICTRKCRKGQDHGQRQQPVRVFQMQGFAGHGRSRRPRCRELARPGSSAGVLRFLRRGTRRRLGIPPEFPKNCLVRNGLRRSVSVSGQKHFLSFPATSSDQLGAIASHE